MVEVGKMVDGRWPVPLLSSGFCSSSSGLSSDNQRDAM